MSEAENKAVLNEYESQVYQENVQNLSLLDTSLDVIINPNLTSFDCIGVLVWHAEPREIWFSPIEMTNQTREFGQMCIRTLFDVWMTSTNSIPNSQRMIDKFKSAAKSVLSVEAAKKVLEKEENVQRQCPECGEIFQGSGFSQRNKYHYHKLSHKLEKFNCDCNMTFAGKTEKQRHVMLVHSGGRYDQCSLCPFVGTKANVQKHVREDHQQYICDICGAVSKNKGTYYAHRRYHKDYSCPECQQTFTGHKTLKAHRAQVHSVDVPKTWPCDQCNAVFNRKPSLADHKRRMHTADESKAHHCEFCGKGFIKKSVLEVHRMSVHIKARPFGCRFECGATFNSTGGRSIHERTIHGELFKPKAIRQINQVMQTTADK